MTYTFRNYTNGTTVTVTNDKGERIATSGIIPAHTVEMIKDACHGRGYDAIDIRQDYEFTGTIETEL